MKEIAPIGREESIQALSSSGVFHIYEDRNGNKFIRYSKEGKINFANPTIKDGKIIGISPLSDEEVLRLQREVYTRAIINAQAKDLFDNILSLLLGDSAGELIDAVCEEEVKSSEPISETPINVNPGPSPTNVIDQQTQELCENGLTTATAQAKKVTLSSGFTYQTSWTITPCQENVEYNIYLANDINDRIGIATGIANKGIASSQSKQFSHTQTFNFICILVSDQSVGENGLACFDII